MVILIIDDYEDIQCLLTAIVEQVLGNTHQIFCASNTHDVSQILDQNKVDLILTDFDYPSGGFTEMLPVIEKMNIPFILISAELSNLKLYNKDLQLGTVAKDASLYVSIRTVLQQIKIQ